MEAIKGARERARAEITCAIKAQAREQLAADGAARLSLRAVARELGMVPSALYRYFPSRDDLLTALIIDAFEAVGEAAETALKDSGSTDLMQRWLAVCRAVRRWALAHPHEYTLIYGAPVPDYRAPQETVKPASRVALVLLSLAESAQAADSLRTPAQGAPPATVLNSHVLELTQESDPAVPDHVLPWVVTAWAQLFGLISFEVFGHFQRVVQAPDEMFDQAVIALAHQTGLKSSKTGGTA
ncbi:TetR/AcrR family transcriptional regulator [Streptomyces sp. WMMB 322]|uniref:TetR/AcrR family transcriptional regulator n=1 Tax=Streptomyces sp. WMMB 322 TaxID=1286821 RepID=UPI0006E1C1FA|nr:TetR/AcrR family transcriptional regulator [Streptomyces sp. WMMB 322]SCK56382.1 transcriptional regulator, TetR family [Streptomyces sp. WMMB 322]